MGLIIILSECIPNFKIKVPCAIKCRGQEKGFIKRGKVDPKTEIVFHKMFSVSNFSP